MKSSNLINYKEKTMTIPDFQTIMLPLLLVTNDEREHLTTEFAEELAKHFALSEQELNELLPSGKQPTFYNRVGWARTYLTKSGLLEMTKKSNYRITEEGKKVIKENPSQINMKFLEQFPGYTAFRTKKSGRKKPEQKDNDDHISSQTPEERMEYAYQDIKDRLATDLLDFVKKSTPTFFERLIIELLLNMGYGGSWAEAARAVGKTGDEGIDGIIDEDRLGLDSIYIQVKKWDSVVSRPEIQKFVGALTGKHAQKGIFITTSGFSDEASKYVATIDNRVVLIDGHKLADYMIDNNVGVKVIASYQLKRIESDYFSGV
jgi:restriction system protein